MQDIIDTHMHIFDLNKFRVLWLEETTTLNKPIDLKDYLEATSKNNSYKVISTIHVELDTIKEQKVLENNYFVEVAETKDTIVNGITIYADMLDDNLDSFLKAYANKECVKAVRYILHVPHVKKGTCLSPLFIKNVKLLSTYNLIFEVCMRCEELNDFYELASMCKETEFVLDHLGLFDVEKVKDKGYFSKYKENIKKISELNNVSIKVSGLSSSKVEMIEDVVNLVFDSFDENKIMFASNFPVCNLSINFNDWACAMLKITEKRSADFREKFFKKNAIKIYKMKGIE